MHKLFEKIFGNPFWGYTIICAFVSVISFFQINSYKADLHHLNGFWLGCGIVFGLATAFFLWKTAKTSTGTGG